MVRARTNAANGAPQGGRESTKAYLVGSGIASLAAAAYLIRDGGLLGKNITVFEEGGTAGGSLDGEGAAERGYVIRGGRMFTYEAYTCLFDLLSFIPSLSNPEKSVSDEVYAFNDEIKGHSRARLLRKGKKLDVSSLGLSNRDRLELIELMAAPESMLGARRIQDHFNPSFFKTNFW
jgi:oleate hydratase